MLNNINNVSFKGTYEFDFAKNTQKQRDAIYRLQENLEQDENFMDYPRYPNHAGESLKLTFIAPDYWDKKIDSYLAAKGINFKKYNREELFSLENIRQRIVLDKFKAQIGYTLVDVKTKEFNELYKKTDSDSYVGEDGDYAFPERYGNFIQYLKSGQEIDASCVNLSEIDGKLKISFIDGRHRYAVLRDLGMENMPICINKESLEVAKKYNLAA